MRGWGSSKAAPESLQNNRWPWISKSKIARTRRRSTRFCGLPRAEKRLIPAASSGLVLLGINRRRPKVSTQQAGPLIKQLFAAEVTDDCFEVTAFLNSC